MTTIGSSAFWAAASLARTVAVGVLAGSMAGLLVGGLGSRVAMRISGALTSDCAGLITENGNRCGEITPGGTVSLLLFAGLFPGILGGVMYAASAPLLQRSGRWLGLVFGLLLLLTFGTIVVEADNVDFTLFAVPWVNIALFALLFPLFGMIIVPIARWTDRVVVAVPSPASLGWRGFLGYLVIAIALLPAMMIIGGLARTVFSGGGEFPMSTQERLLFGGFFYVVLLAPLVRWVRLRSLFGLLWARVAALTLVGAPVILGGIATGTATVHILYGG